MTKVNFSIVKNPASLSEDCSICFDALNNDKKEVVQHLCETQGKDKVAHTFHRECLVQAGNQSNKCPMCRAEYDVDTIRTSSEKVKKKRQKMCKSCLIDIWWMCCSSIIPTIK